MTARAHPPRATSSDPDLQTRRNDRNPHILAHLLVNGGSENHLHVIISRVGNNLGGFRDFLHAEIGAARNREENAARAVNGHFERLEMAAFAASSARFSPERRSP